MSRISMTLASTTLVACIARDDVGHNEGADFDTREDQLRTLTLVSGLSVDVRGDGSAIDALPNPLTGADLCQHFSLSITTTFDAALTPLSYAATAISNDGRGDSSLADAVTLEELFQPLFPDYDQLQISSLGGFAHRPFSVFHYQLSSATFPRFLGILNQDGLFHDAVAPLAVFSYGEFSTYEAFPSIWHDAADVVAAPRVEVWSRVTDPANLLSRPGYAEAVAAAMNMRYVEELATCGDIMAVAYSLPLDAAIKYGVTLYPGRDDWQTVECPRPADASSDYRCFTQTAL